MRLPTPTMVANVAGLAARGYRHAAGLVAVLATGTRSPTDAARSARAARPLMLVMPLVKAFRGPLMAARVVLPGALSAPSLHACDAHSVWVVAPRSCPHRGRPACRHHWWMAGRAACRAAGSAWPRWQSRRAARNAARLTRLMRVPPTATDWSGMPLVLAGRARSRLGDVRATRRPRVGLFPRASPPLATSSTPCGDAIPPSTHAARAAHGTNSAPASRARLSSASRKGRASRAVSLRQTCSSATGSPGERSREPAAAPRRGCGVAACEDGGGMLECAQDTSSSVPGTIWHYAASFASVVRGPPARDVGSSTRHRGTKEHS